MLPLLLALTAPAQAFKVPADSEGHLTPYLRAQVWGTAYDQDENEQADPAGYGDPEDDVGFKLRRLRFGFTGDFDDFVFESTLGMSAPYDGVVTETGDLRIVDAWGGWKPTDWATISAGLQRVPFTRENMTSTGRMALQDVSLHSFHIAPGRDVGVLADFMKSGLRGEVGVFNGNDNLLGDDDAGLMYAARLEYMMGGEHVEKAAYRTYGEVAAFTFGIGAGATYDNAISTNTLSYGGDIIVRTGGLAVLLEGAMANITPTDSTVTAPGVLVDTSRLGYSAQVGYTVKNIEPVVRYEAFNDDMDTVDQGDVQMVTAGVTAHIADDHIQAGAGYILRLESSDYAVSNDTLRLWFQFRY